ncbi:hypothetical protein C8R43DRAFT_1238864 [Mycena crocata]|nr:hypothetical protein C8R43DRAFT_1238864 [Mycena crocata]
MDSFYYPHMSDEVELGPSEVLMDGNIRRQYLKSATQSPVLIVVVGLVQKIIQLQDHDALVILALDSEVSSWQQYWLKRMARVHLQSPDAADLGDESWMLLDNDECLLYIRTDSSTITVGNIQDWRVRCLLSPVMIESGPLHAPNIEVVTRRREMHLRASIIDAVSMGPAFALERIRNLDVRIAASYSMSNTLQLLNVPTITRF